ncbi:Uncharacterized protein C4.03c [Golovinomyces cichoracearum]|uniref:Uncharacterized protein C4.03c n=1 Tax=Golovinomyces cichoracearum TaxID=62708 RepID=A0A420J557_9PEZI|nr:Uncharacterized protein C4.03c [Golovinomyces cichoracearum]
MSENVDYQNAQFDEAKDQYQSQYQIEPEFIQKDHLVANPKLKSFNTGQTHASTMHDVPTQGLGNSSNQNVPNHDTGLTAQIGNLGIADTAPTKRKKIKDRHVYHQIGQNETLPQQHQDARISSQYKQNANSQFPLPVDVPFHPTTPVSQAEFAARSNTTLDPIFAANVQASSQGRVDPDQIPSIPKSREILSQHYLSHIYPTFEHHIPPPACVSFVAFDQGNSSPKFTRLTMNNVPTTSDALRSTGLPLGLLLQPLAPLRPGELEIPVLDFGDLGPPRCHRCRAYINPFMVFQSGGNKFVCNMCNYANDVAPEYFSALTPQGARVDREQRPELIRGTVEFLVPKEYWSKKPVGLHWLFLIDVTQESLNKGFLAAFCEGIITALYGKDEETAHNYGMQRRLPREAKVGIVTFDKELHFYNLNPTLDEAQMLLTSDIDDPFVPLCEGLFVDPQDAKSNIMSLLRRLPALFSQVKNAEPALLPMLNAALAALEKTGGKIICSLATLPTWGPGRLFLRDDGKQHDDDSEKKLFTTEHPGWRKVADKMTQAGVGVDFFMAAPAGGYLDIATIGHVSACTGGEVFYYPNFTSPRDDEKLIKEIVHTLTRETGYQVLMKVRCSNGLQVTSYTGTFRENKSGNDVELGVIDENKAMGVMFNFDGKLDEKLDAHFQSALLYTSSTGERRVRCSNVIASVSDNAKDCMKYVDQDAVYALIAKEAACKTTLNSLKEIRGALSEKNVDILAGYRKNFSDSHPPGQLVLPENLKELSMYILGMIKSRAFKGGQEQSDRRVHDMRLIKGMGSLELSLYLYPRMIPLHNLAPGDGYADEQGHLQMPSSIRCSFSRVEVGGVYLVDNGQNCYLWMHAQTSPNFLTDLFGSDVDSLHALNPHLSSLPVLETHLSAQVRNILEYLKTMRGSKALTIQLARQGLDIAEYEFARLLVEDRNNEAQSYVDWLVHIHRYVQLELTGQRKKEESNNSMASNFAGLRPPFW